MKILLISIFLFISPVDFSSAQNNSVVDDILGKYVLVDIATAITNDTALTELEEWIYKFGFNTICIDRNIIVFGSYATIDPILALLNKEEEYSVKLPNLNRIYTCSDFLGYFPEIKRDYNVVIYINTPLFWVIEPLDKYHIAINVNNMYLLYQKPMD
jgi:hypothetical protein